VLILQGCRTTNNEKKWEDELNNNDLNWKSIYQLPFISTKNSKLQWLQCRINHRILATNSFLKLIKVTNSDLCGFYNTSKERIKHIFWQCPKTKSLVREINDWLSVTLNINISFTITELLFGIINPMNNSRKLNLIILIIKKYIYSTKYK